MRTMKVLAFFAIPIIILNVFISVLSVINIRQQNLSSISNSVSLYETETSTKIKAIQHFIQWSVVHEPLLDTLETTNNLGTKNTTVSALRTRVGDSQYATGTEYQYFMYLEDQDMFFNASELHSSYQIGRASCRERV